MPLTPVNPGDGLLAGHAVRPPVCQRLERTALAVSQQSPGTTLPYLDVNFPFLDRFPRVPHVSHHDGRNVDLAFFYQETQTKDPLPNPPSPIGYGAYEPPTAHEPQPCRVFIFSPRKCGVRAVVRLAMTSMGMSASSNTENVLIKRKNLTKVRQDARCIIMTLEVVGERKTANKRMHKTAARCRQFPQTPLAYRVGDGSRMVARREGRPTACDARR